MKRDEFKRIKRNIIGHNGQKYQSTNYISLINSIRLWLEYQYDGGANGIFITIGRSQL